MSPAAAERLGIDWIAIRGMRNRVFHGYREVRLDIVWATIIDNLPDLITALERDLRHR